MSRRASITLTVVLSWLAGSSLGSITALPDANARTAGIVFGRAHGGYTPEATGRRTITILAIGSDARPGEDPLRSRADSIHVIFLHPRKGKAVIVGIPRDSWVSIPGLGTTKINAAMASGGPERMVRTIEHNFGARIDYWAVTTFTGIANMVDQVEGCGSGSRSACETSPRARTSSEAFAASTAGPCSRSRAIGTACRAATSGDRRTADVSSSPP